jgi:hypothetical protein
VKYYLDFRHHGIILSSCLDRVIVEYIRAMTERYLQNLLNCLTI